MSGRSAVRILFLLLGSGMGFLTALSGPQGLHAQSQAVDIRLLPASASTAPGGTIGLTVQVEPNGQEVNGVDICITFPPSLLQVIDADAEAAESGVQIQADAGTLDIALLNTVDNTAGVIKYSAGTFGSAPSTTFILAGFALQAASVNDEATVVFSTSASVCGATPTNAVIGAYSVLRDTFGSTVTLGFGPEPTPTPTPTPTSISTPAPTATTAPTVATLPDTPPPPTPISPSTPPLPPAAPMATHTSPPTASPTHTPSVTPTAIPTVTPTTEPTPTPTRPPTPMPTATPTTEPTPTPTLPPTSMPTATATPKATPTPTLPPTPTPAPTATPSATAVHATATPVPLPKDTPTRPPPPIPPGFTLASTPSTTLAPEGRIGGTIVIIMVVVASALGLGMGVFMFLRRSRRV